MCELIKYSVCSCKEVCDNAKSQLKSSLVIIFWLLNFLEYTELPVSLFGNTCNTQYKTAKSYPGNYDFLIKVLLRVWIGVSEKVTP